jgi:aprataxin
MSRGNPFKDRSGLGVYLSDPTSPRIIHQTPFAVCINDKFPKATVHTLLLPRSASHNLLHPFDALDDADFLAELRREVDVLRGLAARELQRVLGRESRSEAARQAVLDGDVDADEEEGGGGKLPAGRDWSKEIIAGVHAVPSMSHLHVHVLSRDMHSDALKHRKHYNSFATPFLVSLDDFPLGDDDPRRRTREEAYLRWDLRCWRCGRNFANRFKELKAHLETEFEEWRRE